MCQLVLVIPHSTRIQNRNGKIFQRYEWVHEHLDFLGVTVGCHSHGLYSHSCDRGSKLWPALLGSLTVEHANFWQMKIYGTSQTSLPAIFAALQHITTSILTEPDMIRCMVASLPHSYMLRAGLSSMKCTLTRIDPQILHETFEVQLQQRFCHR